MIYFNHSFPETTWFGTLNKLVTLELGLQFPPGTIVLDGTHLWDFDLNAFYKSDPPHFYVCSFSDPVDMAEKPLKQYFDESQYTMISQENVPNYSFFGRYCYDVFYNDFCDMNFHSGLEHLYMCYNRKPREHRLQLANEFRKNNLLDKGIFTLGEFSNPDRQPQVSPIRFTKNTFDTHVNNDRHDNAVNNIPNDITTLGNLDLWNEHFINIVSETSYIEVFPTEKIFKPIIGKRPFILNAAPGTLALIQQWGFKTFSDYWDESYDSLPNRPARIAKIVSNIDNRQEMYEDMQQILDYNHQYFFNNYQKFNNDVFNNIGKMFI